LKKLVDHFGNHRRLVDVTPGQADAWVQALGNKGLAPATISKLLKRAKQFFRAAYRNELIPRDPFADLKPSGERNPDRKHFVSREVTEKVIAAAPDAEWQLLIALVRYGGLRNPSETLRLEWSHLDWD
jgi:integrase